MKYQASKKQLLMTIKQLLECRIEWNPESRVDPKYIEKLAADIRANKLINPPLLGDNLQEGGKVLADGHRRLAALQLIANQDAKAAVQAEDGDLTEKEFRAKVLEKAFNEEIDVDYIPNECYKKLYTTINSRDLVRPQNGKDNMQSFVLSNYDWDSISGESSLNGFYRSCAQADQKPDATDGTLPIITDKTSVLKVKEPSDVAKSLFKTVADFENSNQYITEAYKWQRTVTPGKIGSRAAGASLEEFYRAIKAGSSLPKMREHYKDHISCSENSTPDLPGFEAIIEKLFANYYRKSK